MDCNIAFRLTNIPDCCANFILNTVNEGFFNDGESAFVNTMYLFK
jgi:hypothetical protein